jgi:hypothetical protein
MSNGQRGKLVLQEVPIGEVEKRIVTLLSKFAKSVSFEELTAKVRNTPYALSNDLPAEKAMILLEALQKLGATAAFVPHAPLQPPVEEITAIERARRFTFDPPPIAEKEPPAVQPQPRKNGVRRLVMTLVTILFLLSMGYLVSQLWPVLGDEIRAWWSYLKQLL